MGGVCGAGSMTTNRTTRRYVSLRMMVGRLVSITNHVNKAPMLGRCVRSGQAVRVTTEHLDARTQPTLSRIIVLCPAPGHVQLECLGGQG
jgi:hypothetical protein